MAPINVLFMTPWYPSAGQPVGGVFVREHARAVQLYNRVQVLHTVGFDPALGPLYRLEQERDPALSAGIPTYRLRWGRAPIPKTTYMLALWSMLQALRSLRAAGFRPDLIHAHVHPVALPAVLLGKLYGLPVVVSEHSTAFPRRLLRKQEARLARLALSRADMVLPVSHTLQRAIEDYGIKARFQVVPNVVDTALFYPPAERPAAALRQLLFVGLLPASHHKGLPYLLQALARLRQRRGDWQLDVVGDGPARAEYEQQARALGLAGQVRFHGLRSKQEVAALMRQADLFVLPSLWENLPCVLVEAQASGLPVVATDTGGVPELIDQSVGQLVPPSDAAALEQALEAMLDRLDSIDRGAIVERARCYSLETIGARLDALYRELLGRPRPARRPGVVE